MASTEFMGKFYLIPENEQTSGESTIYLNFGWNTKGNQSFPPYSKTILDNVCSETQYKKLCDDVTNYLDENGLDLCCAQVACAFSCLILPLCYLCIYVNKINNDIKQIISNNTKDWMSCTASMELMQASGRVTNVRDGVGYREDGTVMTRPEMTSRGSHSYPTGRQEAAWPPLGYNIVLKIKGMSIRQRWPMLAVGEVPTKSAVMDREINIADELEKLVKLNKDGYLTDSEFIAAKAKVLNQS